MTSRLILTLVLSAGLLGPAASSLAKQEDPAWYQSAMAENGGPGAPGVSRFLAAATPEPGSLLLLAAGGVVLALGLRRRRG